MKMLTRLIALLLAFLLPLAGLAETPIEKLGSLLLEAQQAWTQSEENLAAADKAVAELEKKYNKNPNSTKIQDQLIDAMVEQELAYELHAEAQSALTALQKQQAQLAKNADCEDLYVEYDGKYADLAVTVTVDENMVIYGLEAEIKGGERDKLVGENDYLYQFIGKDIPLTIGNGKKDDVAPLKDAQQTAKDLVAALNSLIYEEPEDEPTGPITDPQGIADYIFQHGKLPDNFITKKEAQNLGWDSSYNYVGDVAPGKSIGGDRFGNYEGLLPSKKGRTWYEADCYYEGKKRNAHRILYSNDGLVYYTDDHYESFTQMFPSDK